MKKFFVTALLIALVLTQAGCYSCQTWNTLWGKGQVPETSKHRFFWDKDCKPMRQGDVDRPGTDRPCPGEDPCADCPSCPPEAPAPIPAPPVKNICGDSTLVKSYPCEECEVIVLTKQMPSRVLLNKPFDYTITVKNVSNEILTNVVVTERLADNFNFISANPNAGRKGNDLSWKIPTFGPGKSVTITITGSATTLDCVQHCSNVTYDNFGCAAVEVVQPMLAITKTAPSKVMICEPIPLEIVVTNTGTGDAENVVITDILPDGLTTTDGKTSIKVNAGNLAQGASKKIMANLVASKTGVFTNTATVSSDNTDDAQATATTTVVAPNLSITKVGPARQYLGKNIKYTITVTNHGNAPAVDLVLDDTIPAGIGQVKVSDGGVLAANRSSIQWALNDLAPGKSQTVTVEYVSNTIGSVSDTATVTAKCAEAKSASATTQIIGIPAVLLEVVDLIDPVEIGEETTYRITATNQGSSVGTNIAITCMLESNEQFIDCGNCATQPSVSGGTVSFAPLASLAPHAEAVWEVKVKAVAPGDVRFKVSMNTDQIGRPVEETESTHLYQSMQ